jgi:NAD(P)-dependent dehydrogenase (short-subunit alcohol dehydrogenase family)
VNSAGVNVPQRKLSVLSNADFRSVIEINLMGTYWCIHEFLPMMREAKNGTIVNIVSDAGMRATPAAGSSYIAAKFGQRGLAQAINLEERANGVRCCSVCPGEINTPILDKRPVPPPAEARLKMLQSEDVAKCVLLAIELPPRAIVEELLVRPA